MTDITLSIVIVEYHSIQEIKECVVSLKDHIHVPYEIIVSSNSCYNEKQKEEINLHEEHVRWLFNEHNDGFAYAMNNGLKAALGKYLVIMNSDCTMESELNKMTEMIKFASIIVAAAPMLIAYPFVQKYFEKGLMAGAVKG